MRDQAKAVITAPREQRWPDVRSGGNLTSGTLSS